MANKWQRRRWEGLGNRCEVKMYIPPEPIVEIAEERTRGLVMYFEEITRFPCDFHFMQECVANLARSCYMQGAQDVADAAAKMMLEWKGSSKP